MPPQESTPRAPTLKPAHALLLEVGFDPPIAVGRGDPLKVGDLLKASNHLKVSDPLETRFDPPIKVGLGNQLEVRSSPPLKVEFDPPIEVGLGDLVKARFKARFDPLTKGTKFKSTKFRSSYKLAVVKKVLQINLPLVI